MTLNRSVRRMLVAAFFLMALVFTLSVDASLGFGVHLAIFGVALLLFAILIWTTQSLAFRSGRHLDERQMQVSLKANQTGLLVGATVVLCILLVELVEWQSFGFKPNATVSAEDIALIVTIFVCLPTMIIAWQEADPLDEVVLSEIA